MAKFIQIQSCYRGIVENEIIGNSYEHPELLEDK